MKICKYLAIITARKNSVRVKNKNLVKLNGKPLLKYTLDEIVKSKKINHVFVSSDSQKILSLSKKYKMGLIKRPSGLAKSTTSSEKVLLHAINFIHKNNKIYPKNIVFIQPNSPLTKSYDFDNAIKFYEKKKSDSLFSSYKAKYFIWLKSNSRLTALTYNFKKRKRTNHFKDLIIENGSFFIFKTSKFLKFKNRLFGKISTYLMPKYRSFEIDYPEDINFLKKLKF